jgi:riboflavin kinase/FMN adenylyltransferase
VKLIHEPSGLSGAGGPVVLAIGVFDGVHLGHRAVLDRALVEARASGALPVAATFDPHPAKVLRPDAAPRLLTATAHKLRLIEALGYQHALLLSFDARLAATPPEEFLAALTRGATRLQAIVVGCDWRFGRGRQGTVGLIRATGAREGFDAIEIPAVQLEGAPVSSTRIREAVQRGDLAQAARCLGRPYAILGTVIAGDQIGRKLGFPTANLRAHNEQFPPDGVYAISSDWHGRKLSGVANIGWRPTIGGNERRLEVHFLDFAEDLYGCDIEVAFDAFLRPEQRFPGPEALSHQIGLDVAAARALENRRRAFTLCL